MFRYEADEIQARSEAEPSYFNLLPASSSCTVRGKHRRNLALSWVHLHVDTAEKER